MENLNNFLHLMAAIVWIGGASYFQFILRPLLKQIDPQQAGKLMGLIAKRFSITAWVCILTLLVTGFFKTPSGLWFDFSSEMGQILLAKHLLVTAILGVGLTIGLYVVPRMHKHAPQPGAAPAVEFIKYQKKLGTLATVNLLLGALVVLLAAHLW